MEKIGKCNFTALEKQNIKKKIGRKEKYYRMPYQQESHGQLNMEALNYYLRIVVNS
jgi:hypothetical protein